jgi:hypothetical protein
VETGVQIVQRWIVAALRHRKFFSLAELNQAMRELLDKLNQRPFRKRPGCRGWRIHCLLCMRPTDTGNLSVNRVLSVACSGFLTVADMKCAVGATRESSAGPVVRPCGSSSGAGLFRTAHWVISIFLTLPGLKSSQL